MTTTKFVLCFLASVLAFKCFMYLIIDIINHKMTNLLEVSFYFVSFVITLAYCLKLLFIGG